eukprot:6063-Eustigmatos_ZCMA.PRE.1
MDVGVASTDRPTDRDIRAMKTDPQRKRYVQQRRLVYALRRKPPRCCGGADMVASLNALAP